MTNFLTKYTNHILLHFIVLIWGFTGILGKLITLDSDILVGYRMLIALFGILAYLLITRSWRFILKSFNYKYVIVGLVVAAHWICFFESIKVSNVSVALATISSTTLFVAFIEPIFYKRKVKLYEVVLGVFVIFGLGLIFKFEPEYHLGIILSLMAALLAAIFGTINGLFVKNNQPSVISLYEMFGGVIGVVGYLWVENNFDNVQIPNAMDSMYLVVLGLICTAFAFVVSVKILKTISPYTASISINMEPIYAILLALWIFGEEERMTGGFYLGALIIMVTIFGNAWLKRRVV